MTEAAAQKPQARSINLRMVSISGVTIGTVAGLVAAASALASHFAMIGVASAADVLAKMI